MIFAYFMNEVKITFFCMGGFGPSRKLSLWDNDLPSHFNLLLSQKRTYGLDIGKQVNWGHYQ